ncbi:MAG: GNAT family N-acetyltransferase [Gammaproteobacteria bacterium]|nr:GNAT family N-acetyltransferase [Gammaproteobacteria bacterium]MDE0247884.1 GNAT family N-acetyltransferase [Gammaproteobacteria bacterium]
MRESPNPDTGLALRAGPVHLQLREILPGDPSRGLAATHHFEIMLDDGTVVGHINLRIGSARHLIMTVGHIGYAVRPEHRGHSYSYLACLALAPFARQHYDRVILTVDPDNTPSIRIIEKLGAVFVEEVVVLEDDPAYANGARRKKRYEWVLRSRAAG